MGNLFCDAYRQEGLKTIAGLARSRTMRPPVNAYVLHKGNDGVRRIVID
jgi:hypothetical protein